MKVYMVIAHDNDNGVEEETYIAKLENEQEDDLYLRHEGWIERELLKYGLIDNDIHFYAMSGDYFHNGVMKMGDFDYTLRREMEK